MSSRAPFRYLLKALVAGYGRLDKSFSPLDTLAKLRQYQFTFTDSIYLFQLVNAAFWLALIQAPILLRLAIPTLFAIALAVPFTSQFFVPATPIFSWLITFFSSRFIPPSYRPPISVSLLPTLESVLYGANISDILTRFTHPVLDIIAWLPYGVAHYTLPFVVAAFLFLFRTKPTLHLWARVFGYMNLAGVFIQIIFPCAAPWYELIYGLTPANYSVHGSPGGLGRIDTLFHSHGYTTAFSNSPVVFGAFPSLHAGNATLAALFLSHFFPQATRYIWSYTGLMYWATMYLTHHYLIDVVGGACLATALFYVFLPDSLRHAATATALPPGLAAPSARSKYEIYDLEAPRAHSADEFDVGEESAESDSEDADIAYRSPVQNGTPMSAAPLIPQQQQQKHPRGKDGVLRGGAAGHRHTASIVSLIRADERAEEGWRSPVTSAGNGFAFPPTPTSATMVQGER